MMRRDPSKPVLRLPERFVFTVLRFAVAGAVACSEYGTIAGSGNPDAAPADAQDECANPQYYCSPSSTVDGAVCRGYICDLSQCPPGCLPLT